MRKLQLLLLVILAVAVAVPAHAQTKMIGVFGGVDLAKVKYDNSPAGFDIKWRPGPIIGVVGDLGLTDMLGIRIEPAWAMRGSKFETTGITPQVTTNWKFSTIEVPVLLRLSLTKAGTMPYVMAGPAVGFRLSAKQDVDGVENAAVNDSLKSQTKSSDIGLQFGAGVNIPAGKNAVFVEGRYLFGMQDIINLPSGVTNTNKVKNQGVLLTVGVTFPFAGIY